jgi:FkbM family methyltransferase
MSNPLLSIASFTARILPAPVKRAIYRIEPLARLIRGSLNKAAPSGLTVVEIAAGNLAGYKFWLDLQTEKDYWLGTYEPELQAAVRELVPPAAVVYDVGANIGYITTVLAEAAGEQGRVFAFEALLQNVERLRKNLELNGLQAQVSVFAGAVSDSTRPVTFLVHASGGMGKAAGSAGRDEPYQAEVTVPGLALDDFVFAQGNPSPQVLKMDIEGGEVLALPGMARILKENPPLMLLELHGPEAAGVAWEKLTRAGYTIHEMRPGYPAVPSLEALNWKAYLVGMPPARS